MAYLPPAERKRSTSLVSVKSRSVVVRDDWRTVQTSLDKATKIRNPVSAWLYGVGANARVSALQHAERLGQAAEKAAKAEATAADALLHRADRLAELAYRHHVESDIQNNRIAEQRHKIDLDVLRRLTEQVEAERRLLDAKHAFEAAKKFKPKKFELGQARYEARIAESRVDTAVARAAGGASSIESEGDPAAEIVRHLDKLIVQRLADGGDIDDLHNFLGKMKKILAEAHGNKRGS